MLKMSQFIKLQSELHMKKFIERNNQRRENLKSAKQSKYLENLYHKNRNVKLKDKVIQILKCDFMEYEKNITF